MDYQTLLQKQRAFFASGETRSLSFRLTQLKKIKSLLKEHQAELQDALKKDLHRSCMESFLSEFLLLDDELDYIIKNLPRWVKPQKVSSPFPIAFPGKSTIHAEPYGSVLIMGAWNFPLEITLSPLIGAISAGNCVVLKPSEVAVHTEKVLSQILQKHFNEAFLAVVTGGPDVAKALLNEKWDYLFFTGNEKIGKIVAQEAAKHLTPITLELGGKNPCIVDETANLDFAARRIIRAKMMNAGQLCLAPDYLLVHSSCKVELIKKLKYHLHEFYGQNPKQSESFGRIINTKHFDRLTPLLEQGTILVGGDKDKTDLYIAPTLMDDLSWEDGIMQEEIFGPILPIMTYTDFDSMITILKNRPKPLALYLFTRQKEHEGMVINQLSFGGGCINDCLLQHTNNHLPFGGVGQSGIGRYHGRFSFDTFSHHKGIYKRGLAMDVKLEYPPYTDTKYKWIKRLFKML